MVDLIGFTTWDNTILEPIALWVLTLIIRYAATGIYYRDLGKLRSSGTHELFRSGVDVAFIALGMSWSLGWGGGSNANVRAVAFIVGICITYLFFLFVEGKQFSEIFSVKRPYFLSLGASWYFGWLVLRGAVLLKGGN